MIDDVRLSPTPPIVHEIRERIAAGVPPPLRPYGSHEPRPYFCRSCGAEERGAMVPAGWYSLRLHGGESAPPQRLGLYCSLICLQRQMPRLLGINAALAAKKESVAP